MIIAIVLTEESALAVWRKALDMGLIVTGWHESMHHVTLALDSEGFTLGEKRTVKIDGFGQIRGRVTAFRVAGVPDCQTGNSHITISWSPEAKPKEAKEITIWDDCEPLEIEGTIEKL